MGFWQEDQSERRKGMGNGRACFLKIDNIVSKKKDKPKNEGTLSVFFVSIFPCREGTDLLVRANVAQRFGCVDVMLFESVHYILIHTVSRCRLFRVSSYVFHKNIA